MRIIFLALIAAFLSVPGIGQGVRGTGQGPRGQAPNGRFYGKVVDASKKGIEAASVTLVRKSMDSVTKEMKEVMVGGMLTTASGDFSIENVPVFGRYLLRISGIGYKVSEQNVAFQMPNRNGGDPGAAMGVLDKDLGNIRLELDDKVLGNVTVTGSRPMYQMGIDRKVFNVENNLVSAGGSAVDVMKNVPSVSVDLDGNVSLRNSAPQIFVDGRPTNLTLDQIPADAIESVEVITNPSAKFDASGGTAGILNIVLKKNKRVGYSGNVRANIDSRAKLGFGANANVRQNKINFFVMGNYNQRKSISKGTTDRFSSGPVDLHTYQKDKSVMEGVFGFGRAGFDYFIDNRNTLTVNGSFARGKFDPQTSNEIINEFIYQDVNNNDSIVSQFNDRRSYPSNLFRNWGTQLSFKHNFPKTGQEWTADVTYNEGRNNNENFITTDIYDWPQKNFTGSSALQQIGGGSNNNLIMQTDYVNPIGDHSKLEAGARTSIRSINNLTNYYTLQNGTLNPIPSQNVDYSSTDNVYAAYANFSNRIKNFGYQVGLRAESSNYEGIFNKTQDFDIEFPISLFPSVFLTQKVGENDEFQLNYSRRINRPNFWQLFPFYDVSDSLSISRGNPELQPEFTNSFELSYSKTFKNRDNFLASVYFKNTTDLITRIQPREFVPVYGKEAPVLTYTNANNSYVTGLELTAKNKLTKWWEVMSNANFYTAKIDLKDTEDPDQFLSYFLRLNNNFKISKSMTLQLSSNYDSKRLVVGGGGFGGGGGGRGGGGGGGGFGGGGGSAQGYIRPQFEFDAGLRYDFLKDRAASLSLSINDIFRSRNYDAHTEADGFVQDVFRRRDQQIVRLNFSYRFGKFDASLFKRKNNRADNDQGGDPAGF